MSRVWRAVVLATVVFLAGCMHDRGASSAATGSSCTGGPIAQCTRQPARYPDWVVGLADPVAPLIGRTIALVKFRKGYLAKDMAAQKLLESTLQPLDIVLVSAKGRLSGNTIPGLFTHTIVYLGTQKQLARRGVWDDPGVAKFREAIESGKTFVESDKKGVHLSTMEQISDVDRILVLRPRFCDQAWVRKSLLAFFDHIGTRFDFRFNAGDDRKLFCSELAFHVLPELKLPVRHFYDRDVVLPDDIAATGLEGKGRLSFVLYIRGEEGGWTRATRRQAITDLSDQWRQ